MKSFFTLFLLLTTCFFATTISAQKILEDVVYLKDGSVLRGKVLSYNVDAEIKVQIEGGSILVYPSSKVVRIEKEEKKTKTEPLDTIKPLEEQTKSKGITISTPSKHIPKRGIYGALAAGTILPNIAANSIPLPAVLLDGAVGYRIHRLLGIGIGGGTMFDYRESFLYGYGTIRGAILNTSLSPFYEIRAGYGAPLFGSTNLGGRDVSNITSGKGGLYLRPSIGLRFRARNRMQVFVDIGFYLQNYFYEGTTWNNFPLKETYTYKRFSVHVGVLF